MRQIDKFRQIEKIVCDYYELDPKAIHTPSRVQKFVNARILTWWYIRKVYETSYKQIGEFYNRHHTTVMHALRLVENSIETKQYLYEDLMNLDVIMRKLMDRNNTTVIIELENGMDWRDLITDVTGKYKVLKYELID